VVAADYPRWQQMLAPEAVTIAVGAVSLAITNVDAAGNHVLQVTADAEVIGVAWSATGLLSGYRIRIAYSIVRYCAGRPAEPEPPVIEAGTILPAYLGWDGYAYAPAARSISFTDLSGFATDYPANIRSWSFDPGWRQAHPGYGRGYPGARPGLQPHADHGPSRGLRRLTALLGA
jgi:hypothetical protein